MLDGLWRDVMGPVLAALPAIGLGPGAPLVLLPQGDLALMPLHAAGPAGTARCVLDEHEVRYAPSGYALQTADGRLKRRQQTCEADAAGREHPLIDAVGRGRGLSGAFNPMKGTEHALPHAEDTEILDDFATREHINSRLSSTYSTGLFNALESPLGESDLPQLDGDVIWQRLDVIPATANV